VHTICFGTYVAAEKNADSQSASDEGKTSCGKQTQQEHQKSHVNKEQPDEYCEDAGATAAAATAAEKQFEGTVTDASKPSGGTEYAIWLPGWNLTGLTQLTGAVTSTVKRFKICLFTELQLSLCRLFWDTFTKQRCTL